MRTHKTHTMKKMKLCIFVALTALCITGCDCLDCGTIGSSITANTVIVTKDVDGTFVSNPGDITLISSCAWTATNMTPEYIDFDYPSGSGGAFNFPVHLTQALKDALNADPSQFPGGENGLRIIGTIRFDSNCDDSFDLYIYYDEGLVLIFDSNGANGNPPAPRVLTSGTTMIPDGTGMNFDSRPLSGWSTQPNGGGTFYKANESATFTVSTTLYALWNGDGSTAQKSIHIYNRRTLMEVEETAGESLHYLVVADFDANWDDEGEEGQAITWKPIGGHGRNFDRFAGKFNGNGHTIAYTIKDDAYNHLGLFAFIACEGEGEVKDLSVAGSIIANTRNTQGLWAGGIAGISEGLIEGCYSAVSIELVNNVQERISAGGIVGVNYGIITACVATGSIEATDSNDNVIVGGIAGTSNSNYFSLTHRATSISYCVSTSTVKGVSIANVYAGGIVGNLSGSSSSISNCVAINVPSPDGWSINADGSANSECGRIAGQINSNGSYNYADEDMKLKKAGSTFVIPSGEKTGTGRSGENITQGAWRSAAWWAGLGGDWANHYGDFDFTATL